ncbi:hypothetical protein [Lyngbya confervoides]|uniref:Uncharacterized protein n=1 Tax=Lyngbya confervoides BDU141951 TaxID=1574623 RepID=A0ABD4SZ60_9CYAN|nr:hypothetical protein [Lyngbya confervoides]MCM1981767.1 hypothetical protein [Lyngbya confervoides BDU141951]
MPDSYSLGAQRQELQRLGFEILKTDPHTLIAKRHNFYWDCLLTCVNYTVFVRSVDCLTPEMMAQERQSFFDQAQRLNPSPLPRGLQSGNAILVAYLAKRVTPEAQRICLGAPQKYFAQFYLPAVWDHSQGQLFILRQTPYWGRIYFGKFRYILSHVLLPHQPDSGEPRSQLGTFLAIAMILWFGMIFLLIIALMFSA